ncbi:MAG: hypothetical protein ACREM3_23625 [Candidatus Rokuibacteriota bacterium]
MSDRADVFDSSRYYERSAPTPDEYAIFRRGVDLCRRHGLAFPPGRVECYWTSELADELGGVCYSPRQPGARVTVFFRRGLGSEDLRRLVVHELKHAWDALFRRDIWESERREESALAFERKVLGNR